MSTTNGLSFGYVIQPVPKGFPDEIMADPTRATTALIEANERGIRAARPRFDTVWAEDHFMWDKRPVLEAITVLSYLIGRHEGMRFGHLVLGQSYRNPALTAKMAAMMQVLAGGNFILGIGAGWKEDEYRAYGYPYPPAAERIDQLEEAVQIIKALWTQSPATFHGNYYHIENAECQPQPNPPIPLFIAGGGEKKTLRVVAKYADWWNVPFVTADEFAHKQRVLEEHCREIGRDPSEIMHTYYGLVSLVDDPSMVEKRDVNVVGGTSEVIAEELLQFVRLGVKHFQLRFLDFPSTDGLEKFIDEVIPKLSAEC
jgi:alkanesulfonate monooxygenase SsuD/methylene tetrahydromethanopterin reductase-like flavin-dependent oxidoreductase (luciferase family)